MDEKKIGNFISELRKEKKLTQEQLADKLNVTSKSISRWENGITMPDYSLIKLLCDELGITINELLSGERIKTNNYEFKANENLDSILKEYHKLKKQKSIIKNILIIVLILFGLFIVRILFILGIVSLSFLSHSDNISGIENYNKNYYIKEYGGDLDSNLSIFPDNTSKLLDAKFSSSFKINFFDSDGYIILTTKYNEEDFNNEVSRLSKLELTISNCKDQKYVNYVKYDDTSYKLPAYITIDGFDHTYEYALINDDKLEIVYIYLSYPTVDNEEYNKYLKKDILEYWKINTINMYSMYNHSFDDGESFIEYGDC